MSPSLYQRLGGAAGLVTIVDNAVDRHAANPTLVARFRGQDLPQLKTLSVSFLSAGTGGPRWGEACGARAAHAGMRFSDDELTAVVDDVAAALVDQGADAAEVGEVISLFRALKGESRAADSDRPRAGNGAVGRSTEAIAWPAHVQGPGAAHPVLPSGTMCWPSSGP